MPAILHYIYDPLCGWCYGAEPLVRAAGTVLDLKLELHAGGLWPKPTHLPPEMRHYIRDADARIAQISGQPFGQAYLSGLLLDPTLVLESRPDDRGRARRAVPRSPQCPAAAEERSSTPTTSRVAASSSATCSGTLRSSAASIEQSSRRLSIQCRSMSTSRRRSASWPESAQAAFRRLFCRSEKNGFRCSITSLPRILPGSRNGSARSCSSAPQRRRSTDIHEDPTGAGSIGGAYLAHAKHGCRLTSIIP